MSLISSYQFNGSWKQEQKIQQLSFAIAKCIFWQFYLTKLAHNKGYLVAVWIVGADFTFSNHNENIFAHNWLYCIGNSSIEQYSNGSIGISSPIHGLNESFCCDFNWQIFRFRKVNSHWKGSYASECQIQRSLI